MTDSLRLPFPLSANETMLLRKLLARESPHINMVRDLTRRLEDHFGVVNRETEAARHAEAMRK